VTTKLTKAECNAVNVHNSYNLCELGGGTLYVGFCSHASRAGIPSGWKVVGLGFQTDPKAHWTDNGCKTFDGKKHSEAKQQAMDWASEKYGVEDWVRDPFGGYQDKKVFDAAVVKARKEGGR